MRFYVKKYYNTLPNVKLIADTKVLDTGTNKSRKRKWWKRRTWN